MIKKTHILSQNGYYNKKDGVHVFNRSLDTGLNLAVYA